MSGWQLSPCPYRVNVRTTWARNKNNCSVQNALSVIGSARASRLWSLWFGAPTALTWYDYLKPTGFLLTRKAACVIPTYYERKYVSLTLE